MATIQELYEQAQLAEAAYADFLDPSKLPADALQTGDSKFSATQAATFVRNWEVVDQYTSPPGPFALRGTQPGYADLAADGRNQWGRSRLI